MSKIFCSTIEISHENFKALPKNTSDIKIFKIKLSSYYGLVAELKKYLDEAELKRAQNYHFEKDTNQFVICRALLKVILAHHTALLVSEIKIKTDSNRKPFLDANKRVYFNVSHAGDYGIILVRNYAVVGIDIEYVNNDFNFSEIMPDIYSPLEIETVLKATHKAQSFFKFWTRKEAIVKATGTGISDYLPQIPAGDGLHLVKSKLLDGLENLQVFSFEPFDNYMASVALSGHNLDSDKLIIYELPNSLEELLSFSNLQNL